MSHDHTHTAAQIPGVRVPKYCLLCGGAIQIRCVKKGEPDRHVCAACGEVHWLDPKLAVGVVAEYQGGLVMLKRDIDPGRGKWVYPGGFVDRGETLEQAARREAREEALIELGPLELLGAFSYAGHPVVLISYTAQVVSGTPQAGDEAQGCEIWPLDRIRWDDLAFRSTRDAVQAFVKLRAR